MVLTRAIDNDNLIGGEAMNYRVGYEIATEQNEKLKAQVSALLSELGSEKNQNAALSKRVEELENQLTGEK
ncbi:hypothetical protein [Pragia fontium]|uniref:hypothetical protein n=1 Tax=Pragia fontium TaxID=82985 RepID=UPI000F6F332C|nr:hypothetical protein [Pragia fontium]VEJ54591.1 Uncharacterised protein [Pragia fontium]